jgi:polysaccharide biosynthesis protein PslH
LRILWIKSNKILPTHSGGNIRSYQILRRLASKHELIFFSYYDGASDSVYEKEIARQFPSSVCLCTGKLESTSSLRRGFDYLLRLPLSIPYAVSRFQSAQVRDKLKAWFQERPFDVAVCDFLDAAVNLPSRFTVPTVLFQHNVESEIWRRHVLAGSNQARRLLYGVEFVKMLRYERNMVRRFDRVIAVSEHDRQLMSEWTDASRIAVVPTGVDLQQYQLSASSRTVEPLILFVGAMDWEPNIDAAEYFCREIWPLIQANVPAVQFRIVGRNPTRRVLKLASGTVEVTGSVPSIVGHLHQAAVVVVPLRVGGGTRLKIYEAMAAGKAVVSTTIGAEGLDVHHDSDIILADDPNIFAKAVIGLLLDSELRRRFESAAASTAAKYDWAAIGDKFGEVLQEVAKTSGTNSTETGVQI